MEWRQYQEAAATLFRSLDCDVQVEVSVRGARAEHRLDLWVRFRRFGLETKWVVECKCWETNVPKEKVLALRAVVEDVGADRGILISKVGFQSGALRAAEKTNITLTSLEELRETAQEDLLSTLLGTLERRAIVLKNFLLDLFSAETTGPGSWVSRPLPGVDGMAVNRAIGQLGALSHGFDRAKLGNPPYPVRFDDAGQGYILAWTLDEFVKLVGAVVDEVQATLEAQPRLTIEDSPNQAVEQTR